MKFLILGGSGMAGHVISLYLNEKKHDVTVFSRTPFKYCKNILGDATDFCTLEKIIIDGNYDYVVNCIGILNNSCDLEIDNAILMNSYLPHKIATIINERNTKLIHLSTDCVFSGKKGKYNESCFKDGESIYDLSKSLGEVNNKKDLTFRNSIVGPDMRKSGIGLFNWFMNEKKDIYGYKRVMWTGVTTLTLAKAIEAYTKENVTGIYHLVNNESISKFDLLTLFNKKFYANKKVILDNCDLELNKTLINTREDFSFKVPSYNQMVNEMGEWINNHKYLYEHYNLKGGIFYE